MKYPALDKTVNLKTRSELIDFDYIGKLSDSEKAWLNKFVEENIHASFRKNSKTKKERKKIYAANNARNRCIYTKSKAQGKLDYIEDLKITTEENEEGVSLEDQLIDSIDKQLASEELYNLYKSRTNTDKDGEDTK